MHIKQLANLIRMDSPETVLNEVRIIIDLISPNFNKAPIISAFRTTENLYKGLYPGYQACNTDYHDLRHTTDTFIAMARLLHGAIIEGESFSSREILIGLIAALLHDAGYIQEKNDKEGTGAKYTTNHVQRSITFFYQYGKKYRFSDKEIKAGECMILCTDLDVKIPTIEFPSIKVELLGKMLGTSDLLAQMADRTYLEKLLFLYFEFKEGNIRNYKNTTDFFRKTMLFYDFIANRLKNDLGNTDRFMTSHFSSKWNISTDLYADAILKQKKYLRHILEMKEESIFDHLKRNGIVGKVQTKYGKLN